MKFKTLGPRGPRVSVVSLGTAPLGGLFGRADIREGRALVEKAAALGINLIDTSPYYGDAEQKLGTILGDFAGDDFYVSTKAGRYGWSTFDFSPESVRKSLDRSLSRLGRDAVDLFQLHDIDFVELGPLFEDTVAEMIALRDEGKCKWIGMTCYSLPTTRRVLLETPVDVALNYGHGTLLDNSMNELLAPLAKAQGIGLMNAAAVSLGLLTPKVRETASHNIASTESLEAAKAMASISESMGVDLAMLANQYAIQRSGGDTTVVGTMNLQHLEDAVVAADAPINEEVLASVLEYRLPLLQQQWVVGNPLNEDWSWLQTGASND